MILTRILGGSTALFAILAGLFFGLWTLERARHQNTRAEYAAFKTAIIDKTAVALAEQKAQTARLEKRSVEQASIADSNYRALFDHYSRVLSEARRGSSASSTASEGDGAGGVETAGAGAIDTLVISADDALICAENTARLQVAVEWATTLN